MSKVQASPSTSVSNVQQASTVQTGGDSSTHARDRRALSTPFTVPPSPSPPSFTVVCEGLTSSQCGANLADALAGDEAVLELEAGTYTHSSTFTINRDVTVRTKTSGTIILDGEDARRVMLIKGGTVDIEGIEITRGKRIYVCSCLWNLP